MVDPYDVAAALDALDDAALLRVLNTTLAKRQTPLSPEEKQAAEDDETYRQYFPGERQ